MNTFCVNALGNTTGTPTETLGPRPAKWPALRFVERGEPVDLSAGFARSHQPMRAFQQRAQTCEASLGIPRPRFFASFASVMCLHQVVQRHTWLFPLQWKFLFCGSSVPASCASVGVVGPSFSVQPLAPQHRSLVQRSTLGLRPGQCRVGACFVSVCTCGLLGGSFSLVPLGARFHVVLRVGGMPSVCWSLLSPVLV